MAIFSIIILTYNSNHDIINCIESIYNTLDIPREQIEIIVVDNSSTEVFDELKSLVYNKFGDEIILIKNINGGYGQGNNVGIRASKGQFVCIVNPDVLFTSKMFSSVAELFNNNKKLALIGGKQYGGKNISFKFREEYDFFAFTEPLVVVLNKINLFLPKFSYLSGALLFIDKEKFNSIGLFDETFFLYCEESDICKRFLSKNYQIIFEKNYAYRHLIDGRNHTSDFSFQNLIDSSKKYLEKHNFSYEKFILKKIISYQIILIICKLINNKTLISKNRTNLNRFLDLKNKLNERKENKISTG